MTTQKLMEERLLKSQKMEAIGTLAGGIAHDFNNILASIVGYNELTKLDMAPHTPEYQYMEEAIKAGMHAKDLIQQILTFSRTPEKERSPISIRHIVIDTLRMLRSTLPTTIEIQKNILPTGSILADPVQIQQVIMNLATNALQAMTGETGVLTLELEEVSEGEGGNHPVSGLDPGRYVRLRVGDTGHGMETETIRRIFDPYFSTRKDSGGSGLGLSVVHGIVTQNDGKIEVFSRPGRGTTFNIYFPLIAGKWQQKKSKKSDIPKGKETVLYVDDDVRIAKMGLQLLKRLGYNATSYNSSPKALAAFRHRPDHFDLIITDMTMPEMTGLQFAQKVREVKPDIPIILCTGYNEAVDEETALAQGINAFCMKPITLDDFATLIRGVLPEKKDG